MYIYTNENTTYKKLWDTSRAVLREKFIALSTYNTKKQQTHNNNLSSTSRTQKKKTKANRRKEIKIMNQ